MSRGGRRDGAGRPSGVSSLLTKELREMIDAERLIGFLQRLADGKIKEASISERKEAAVALLKKVLPDCRHEDVTLNGNSQLVVMISKEDSEL